MEIIVVTGTPGTGKTSYAKEFARTHDYFYIDVNKIIEMYELDDGFDKTRDSKIIDVDKLNDALIETINDFKQKVKQYEREIQTQSEKTTSANGTNRTTDT